jgi:ABC-type branched-subunit amino acid transport system ATPase component/ABC-type branched-subunit amino acid transport system permease subunit
LQNGPAAVFERRPDLWALGPALFILLCVAFGLQLQSYPQYVLAISIISMVVGVALVVLVGLGRCITLASGSIMAVGAYASTLAVADLDLSYLTTLALACIAGGLAGWLIAFPGTRFRGHNLALVTLVFQSVCVILIRESTWLTGGAEGIHVPAPHFFGLTVVSDGAFLILIGATGTVMTLVVSILVRGPFGKNLQAASGNEIASEAFGVSVRGYLTAAFVVSSAAIACAGALLAPRVRIIDPDSFGVLESIFMLAYPIVGGMQSIWGGLLGGGGLRVLPEVLRPVAEYRELFFATLVIVIITFFPGGLGELIRRAVSFAMRGDPPRASTPPPALPSAAGAHAESDASAAELLLVEDVDKHFDALHAVDGASLRVSVGGIHGLIGPNGAGKTSLFNIISGFLDADSGRVAFGGASLLELRPRDRIGLGMTRTFQNVAIFGQLSLLDNVIIGLGRNAVAHAMVLSFDHFVGGAATRQANRAALTALESVGLADRAHSRAGSLSLGDQRRLEIARAIVSDPRLILLDEPVSGVAEAEVEDLRELLLRINAERQISMLVVEHNIPFVATLCRSLSVMGAGRIVAEGKPADVIALPIVRQLYFGEEVAA